MPIVGLTNIVSIAYWYDHNGNMTRRDESNKSWTYTWTVDNRLARATTAGGDDVRFVYDADGAMVLRNDNGQRTVFPSARLRASLGNLYQRNLSTGAQTKHYLFGGKLVAVDDGSLSFLLTDHPSALLRTSLGSVNVTLNADGTIRSRLRYDPWGKQRYAQNNTPTDYRYTAQRFDAKLGIYDYRARYYDPHIARFLSADPIVPGSANPQAFNRYAYVLNNALRFTDPTGHCAQEDNECWQYLENDFCQVVDCNGSDWKIWLIYGQWGADRPYAFAEPWTKEELAALAGQLQMAIDALGQAGINWTQTPLANVKIGLISANRSSYFGIPSFAGEILMTRSQLMNGRTLHHEIGHTFGLQRAFEEATNGGCAITCKRYAAYGTYFREYGRSGNDPLFRAHETWADAFSVFVFTMNHGRTPDPGDRRYGWNVIDMNIFGGNNNPHSPAALEATMLHVHSTTQNILVSRYGYGR